MSITTKTEPREPWFHFHWQSLAEKSRRQWKYAHGRFWMTVFAYVFHVEWHLWSNHCHISADVGGDEEQLQVSCAVPPFAIWCSIQAPHRKCWLRRIVPERQREMQLSLFEWSIRLVLWGREHEWRRDDPWWVRGVHLDLKDLFLGKTKYTSTETAPQQRIEIPLDGRTYHGIAKFERCTWKRRWWFTKTRDSVWIDMVQGDGLPHAGKGESAWNCGDDALCGWGVNGTSVTDAVQHGIDTVMDYRKRYGEASQTARGT